MGINNQEKNQSPHWFITKAVAVPILLGTGLLMLPLGARLAGLMVLMLGLGACNSDNWNHTPPAGMGSIIVDNRTTDGVNVYLDGSYINRVSDFDHEAFDTTPVIHRVVLDESRGSRAWRGDVDVLEGKLTVL